MSRLAPWAAALLGLALVLGVFWPGYMSWENIAEMAKSPLVTFGSHTVNHRNLMGLSADEVRFELAQSIGCQRLVYRECISAGTGVVETANSHAANEINHLVNEVLHG